MMKRMGIDVGGTFTDLIYYDDATGEIRVAKALTTPKRPEEGCWNAISEAGITAELPHTQFFLHGTTVGLNALLERDGAVVGLLCTAGFRDILEIRRGNRKGFDLKWSPPPPLVPRRLRLPVRERISAQGAVLQPLEVADVRAALATFRAEGVTSIAVAFMNAYANGAHELKTREILREEGFAETVSLSHLVSGEYREYERTSTTVIDAFVRARMAEYLGRLEEKLHAGGFRGTCLLTRSGGGSMPFAEADERPFETIMSGPVAGVEGAAELSRRFGLGDLITADVGGTSFDASVIIKGQPPLLYEGSILDLPLQTPWVDVRSIGAGGGSIAMVDAGGLLRVGPRSAGAVPGPACYGAGGTEATVTDAAFYLGMLGDGELASGILLDRDRAAAALRPLAERLGYNLTRTAHGIVSIAITSMANTIREITIERGLDPRTMKLLAFGGAGPMMATELARALGVRHVVIPAHAGNFSAWGLLGADLLRTRARTRLLRLSPTTVGEVNQILAELFDELERQEVAAIEAGPARREVGLDMRFLGQEHTLTVTPASAEGRVTDTAEALRERFAEGYRRTFATLLGGEVEIVSIRASSRRALPRREEHQPQREVTAKPGKRCDAFSFVGRKTMQFGLLDRAGLPRGTRLTGPVIINEPTATSYVDADFAIEVDSAGCLHLLREENSL